MQEPMAIFEENYRVVAVDEQRLVIKGVVTGELLTIVTQTPASQSRKRTIRRGN